MKDHKSLKPLSAAKVEAAVEGARTVMPSTPPSPSLLTEMRSHVDAAISGAISQNEFRLRVEKSIATHRELGSQSSLMMKAADLAPYLHIKPYAGDS